MNRAYLVLLLAALTAACSDAECSSNEVKVGNICRKLPTATDGSASTAEDRDGGSVKLDSGSAPVTGERADTGVSASDSSVPPSPEEDKDSAMRAPITGADADSAPAPVPDSSAPSAPEPVCGDGELNGSELCDPGIASGAGHCDTAETCKREMCTPRHLEGDPDECTAKCVSDALITKCANSDGCCPSGCDTGNDNDCSPSCGNHVIDKAAGETCEPGVGDGCPTSCAPKGCTTYALNGSLDNCNTACVQSGTITNTIAGDSCCPAGATYSEDSDCPKPACTPAAESCDGTDEDCDKVVDNGAVCPAANDCVVGACVGGACDNISKPAGTACAQGKGMCDGAGNCPYCGDGILNGSEQCDPNAPNVGTFNCSPDCKTRHAYGYCVTDDPSQQAGPSSQCDADAICGAELFCFPKTTNMEASGCPILDGPYTQAVLGTTLCLITCNTVSDCPSRLKKCQEWFGIDPPNNSAGYCVRPIL